MAKDLRFDGLAGERPRVEAVGEGEIDRGMRLADLFVFEGVLAGDRDLPQTATALLAGDLDLPRAALARD